MEFIKKIKEIIRGTKEAIGSMDSLEKRIATYFTLLVAAILSFVVDTSGSLLYGLVLTWCVVVAFLYYHIIKRSHVLKVKDTVSIWEEKCTDLYYAHLAPVESTKLVKREYLFGYFMVLFVLTLIISWLTNNLASVAVSLVKLNIGAGAGLIVVLFINRKLEKKPPAE